MRSSTDVEEDLGLGTLMDDRAVAAVGGCADSWDHRPWDVC